MFAFGYLMLVNHTVQQESQLRFGEHKYEHRRLHVTRLLGQGQGHRIKVYRVYMAAAPIPTFHGPVLGFFPRHITPLHSPESRPNPPT